VNDFVIQVLQSLVSRRFTNHREPDQSSNA
jgi:hypothetical protein